MTAVTFGGLASGLDTSSLIDKLVAAERSSANLLTTKQTNLNTQKSIVSSLASAVAALGTAARGLDIDSELGPRTATSSDGHVTVAVSASATTGSHDVRVKQLATSQVQASSTYATNVAGVAGAGTLKISIGGTEKTLSYGPTDSLDTIAATINNANAGVSASVLFDGASYRLVVNAKATGTANAATFTETGTGLGLSDVANQKIAAKNSIVSIDGIDVTRPSNLVSDALPGVTMTLKSVTPDADASGQLAIVLDTDALKTKIQAVVTAYNSVNSALHVQLDYTGTTKGQNTLFGDTTLRQLQNSLGTLMSNSYGSQTLSQLGISRDKTGAMTLDTSKLTEALAADPDVARSLFVSNGFAKAVSTLTDSYTTTSTGILAAKTSSLASRYADLQKQIDRVNTNADALQTRLQRQFAALEQAMSSMQSQSSYLTSALKTS